jgi:hypothetical protein
MQRNNISILLLILVFIGVVLLGYPEVWAGINLNDRKCDFSGTPNETGLCAEVLDDANNKIYVMQICVPDGSGGCLPNPGIPALWPEVHADGSKTYTYSFMQHEDADPECRGVPALNYVFLTVLDGLPPIIASDPSGPKLLTCEDGLKNCAEQCAENTIRVKLSFSYSCTKVSRGEPEPRLFYITMPPGTTDDTTCGSITAVTRDGCAMGENFVYVPSGLAPFAQDFSFLNGTVNIQRNPCDGEVDTVTDENGVPFSSCSPYICFGAPPWNVTEDCINLSEKRVGPPFFGCLFDDAPIPIYGYGDQYWCGQ